MRRHVLCLNCDWDWRSQAARPKCPRCGSDEIVEPRPRPPEPPDRSNTIKNAIGLALVFGLVCWIVSICRSATDRQPGPAIDTKPAALAPRGDTTTPALPVTPTESVQPPHHAAAPSASEEMVDVEVPAHVAEDGRTVEARIRTVPLSTAERWASLGYPAAGGKTVQVQGYTRKDGTYVKAHSRSAPGSGHGKTGRTGRR